MADFDTALDFTLVNEIGDRRHPTAPLNWSVAFEPGPAPGEAGSPVCAGVDLCSWREWFANPANGSWPPDNRPAAAAFYRANFWKPLMGDAIASPIAAILMFDAGVNTWITHPIEAVQGLLGVAVDGKMGPVTLAALNGAPQASPTLPQGFLSAIEAYYRTLRSVGNSELAEWLDRLASNASRLGVAWLPSGPA